MEKNIIRQKYKDFGLLELHVYQTMFYGPDVDYSKIPIIFSNTWLTEDKKHMIDHIGDKFRVYRKDPDLNYTVWTGTLESSFNYLKELGYGK